MEGRGEGVREEGGRYGGERDVKRGRERHMISYLSTDIYESRLPLINNVTNQCI